MRASILLAAGCILASSTAASQEPGVGWCDVEPLPGTPIHHFGPDGLGGMAGDGWDGPGQNPATLFWHVEATSPDLGAGQRAAMIDAMQAWAGVVQVDFVEIAVPDMLATIDLHFATGDHAAIEPAESGDPDCPFDGPAGTVAHAGFPPGVASACIDPMVETFSGNVHFDEAEVWEQDNALGPGPISMTLVACHEIGHALGLTHSAGVDDVMKPSFGSDEAFGGLSAFDVSVAQSGYAAGTGSVVTLEDTGIWVDHGWSGPELGGPAFPFDTVIEAVAGIPPFASGLEVHVEAGTYAAPSVIAASCVLRAENGVVVLD